VKILFSVNYYMKTAGNLNYKAVTSFSDRAPVPHRRQWTTSLHMCTRTSPQINCVGSSRLEVYLFCVWLIIRREATREWRRRSSLHEQNTQKLVLRTAPQENGLLFWTWNVKSIYKLRS